MYLSGSMTKVMTQAEDLADKAGDSFVSRRIFASSTRDGAGHRGEPSPSHPRVLIDEKLNAAIDDLRKGRNAHSATAEDAVTTHYRNTVGT